jgi:protein ImuB
MRALEAIGAAVESERGGEIFFAVDGLRGLHGGSGDGVLAAAWEAIGETGAARGPRRAPIGEASATAGFRQAPIGEAKGTGAMGRAGAGAKRVDAAASAGAERVAPPPLLLAAAPTRFAAFAAAVRAARGGSTARAGFLTHTDRESTCRVAAGELHRFLAPLPVELLASRFGAAEEREGGEMVVALERLGIGTLGKLARLSPDQVADRFGALGLRALRLARGEDEPLRPRTPHEELSERIELPEGTAGRQLDRTLELLVDRLLAAPQRRGRTLLGLRLGALLCGGGSWSVEQGLGRPSASAAVIRRLLVPRLEALPGPAEALRLRALGFGPPARDQLELAVGGEGPRRRRLGQAVREVRAAQGAGALLRILPVDSTSRVPERWAMLTPFPEL